jgi:hypothetical protein
MYKLLLLLRLQYEFPQGLLNRQFAQQHLL